MMILTKLKQYIIHLINHRLTGFLYVIIVIVLTSISIYSIYSVFCDFLYDNDMTSVKVKTTDNVLPFVQYFSLLYYFSSMLSKFHQRSIIPATWTMNRSDILAKSLFPANHGNALSRIATRTNKASFYPNNSIDLPLESQCDIATIAGILYETDRDFWFSSEAISQITYVESSSQFNGGKPKSVNLSDMAHYITAHFPDFNQSISPELNAKLISVIDSFVKNPYGDELMDKLFSKLTPFKYLDGDEFLNLPVSYNKLNHNQVIANIPLDFFVNQTKRVRKVPITFGFIPPDFHVDTNQTTGTEYLEFSFSLFRSPATIFHKHWVSSWKEYVQFNIIVKNSGIYNTTDVRDDCHVCKNLTSVDDCIGKCKVDTVVDVCQCIPFVWIPRYPNDSRQHQELPHCTLQKYADCSNSTKFNATPCTNQEKFKPPCIVSRNNYVVETSIFKPMINNTPKITAQFSTDEKTYVLYQDTKQNSLMQMLGQVGGNLGVFLSFSLLGCWQFSLFMYYTYKRYLKRRKSNVLHETHGFVSAWFRMAQLTSGTHAQGQIGSSQDLCEKADLEEAKKEIVSILQIEMEKQNRDAKIEMERQRQDSKTEMERLKSIISSLEIRLQLREKL